MYYLWSERTVFLNNVGGDDLPTLTKLAGVRNADPSLFAVCARGRRGEGVFFSVLKNVSLILHVRTMILHNLLP